MSYRNIHHPGVPIVVKLGKSAISIRCMCTRRCRHQIAKGDEIAFVSWRHPSFGRQESFAICLDHFRKHFKEI